MRRTESPGRPWAGTLGAVGASLGAAAVFEALTMLETQDHAVRAVSPWQDDPYNTPVSLAIFIIPALALVIGLRLLAWRWPGGRDRGRQLTRTAAVMTAVAGLTAAAEWSAVAVGARRSSWDGRAGLLIGGLALVSLLLVVAAGLLGRCRSPRGPAARWQHDWLDDTARLLALLPVARRLPAQRAARWTRAHAMTVFTAASGLAGAGVTGAMVIGEGWTSPLLIGWAVLAETAGFLAFCLAANAAAGFIAWPPQSAGRRAAQAAALAGGAVVQAAIAFHDQLGPLLLGRPLASVPALAAVTLGPGGAAAMIAAALTLWQLRRQPPATGPTRSCR